jgi:hypothetical protein
VSVAVGCNDSTGPAAPSDFVGNWLATSYVLTSVENTSLSADLIDLGMGLSITFTETTYAGTFTLPGEDDESFSGTYTIDGNELILVEVGEPGTDTMTYTLSGNTLTMTGTDDSFDFDDDGQEDPASFTMVFARQ